MDLAALHVNARNLMVDGQVRPNRVYDRRVLDAMRRLPRERFVPASAAARAYTDGDVPLGDGRFLTEPMVIARLVQLAEIRTGERVLVIGAGAGYSAALVAACGARVIALEEAPSLLALGREALASCAPGVDLVQGPLAEGWARSAPYDVILIDGAVDTVPDTIIRQLRPITTAGGGRLVTVRRHQGLTQGALGEAVSGVLRFAAAFDCATPVLPAFRHDPGFVF